MKQSKYFFVISICLFTLCLNACDKDESLVETNIINGHEWVDLELSVKWGTCNVGAISPEEYGSYFAWGEIEPKSIYTRENSKTYGKEIYFIEGDPTRDAATATWGEGWRMPTKDEMQELINCCKWEWIAQPGKKGYKITSKKNGNSIFLPAAGYYSKKFLKDTDTFCYYWTSTPVYNSLRQYNAYYFFNCWGYPTINDSDRYYGLCIRPVVK